MKEAGKPQAIDQYGESQAVKYVWKVCSSGRYNAQHQSAACARDTLRPRALWHSGDTRIIVVMSRLCDRLTDTAFTATGIWSADMFR